MNGARKQHKMILIWRSHCALYWVALRLCALSVVLLIVGELLDNGIKELSHAVFRDKNEENDEELTKWTNGSAFMSSQDGKRVGNKQQTKNVHTFFPFVFASKNGQTAINQALCYLIHR